MATFTITTLGKCSHYKTTKGKHDIIKHEGRNQTEKNIEVEKLELEKRYQEIIEKSKEKPPPQKKTAAQAESKQTMRKQQRKQKVKNN